MCVCNGIKLGQLSCHLGYVVYVCAGDDRAGCVCVLSIYKMMFEGLAEAGALTVRPVNLEQVDFVL